MTVPKLRYRLSTLLVLALLCAVIFGIQTLRRDLRLRPWASLDGGWRLVSLTVGGEAIDLPNSYLRIHGGQVVSFSFDGKRMETKVTPSYGNIDIHAENGHTTLALFEEADDRLRIFQTVYGTTRPTAMPQSDSDLVGAVLMEFERDDTVELDDPELRPMGE